MLNHIVLMGRLVRDPELRRTRNDVPVASCRMAVNRPGSEKADFIDIEAWRGTADFLMKYFEKGQPLVVSGRLRIEEWTAEGGQKRYSAKVVADSCYFAGGRAGSRERADESTEASMAAAAAQQGAFQELDGEDGELPF